MAGMFHKAHRGNAPRLPDMAEPPALCCYRDDENARPCSPVHAMKECPQRRSEQVKEHIREQRQGANTRERE